MRYFKWIIGFPLLVIAAYYAWLFNLYLHPPELPDLAAQARLTCWYYDIIHHPKKVETWSDKGKKMITEWVRDDCHAPEYMLPEEVSAWVKQIKNERART